MIRFSVLRRLLRDSRPDDAHDPPPALICLSTFDDGIYLGSPRSPSFSSRCSSWELYYVPRPPPNPFSRYPSQCSSDRFQPPLILLLLCSLLARQTLLVPYDLLIYCGTLAAARYCLKRLGNPAPLVSDWMN